MAAMTFSRGLGRGRGGQFIFRSLPRPGPGYQEAGSHLGGWGGLQSAGPWGPKGASRWGLGPVYNHRNRREDTGAVNLWLLPEEWGACPPRSCTLPEGVSGIPQQLF